jgi:hypothetical protein
MLDRPLTLVSGCADPDERLWNELVAECYGLQELIDVIALEPAEFDIYCRIAHWYGYGDRRGRGVKERWGQVHEHSIYRHDDHAYDVGYQRLNAMLPLWCDEGCGC